MLRINLLVAIACIPVLAAGQQELLNKYLHVQQERIGFNGTVLITKNGKELYRGNIGNASKELQVPINNATVFKVASITKQFTAMLVVMAINEGKIHLSDSLPLFFPELKNTPWSKITVHQLLTHTSGIPHNEGIENYWTVKSFLPTSKEKALQDIFSMKLLFEPGTNFKYSSPGYFILSCIAESVYKQPFELILAQKILKPLALSHTGIYKTGMIIPSMSSTYHLVSDSLIVSPFRDFSLMKGSGDMYSTADDLTKWNNSFCADSIWAKTLQKQLFTKYTTAEPYYGYGWYVRPSNRTAYYHGGGNFGCSALSAWYPEEKMSVVILSNVSVLPVNEIWSDVEKIVFNEPFQMPEIKPAIQLSTEDLKEYPGKYIYEDRELNIFLAGNSLYAKLGSGMPFEIYAEDRFTFYSKKVNGRFKFETDSAGNIKGMRADVRNQILYFNRAK